MAQFVQTSVDGYVGLITINRPDRLNALDATVLGELDEALRGAIERPGLRALIITGTGKAFVAGADIAAMQPLSSSDAESFARRGQNILARIEGMSFPVIAAVNGYALGGGLELALACDFIYASDTARLGQPEVRLGVIPGFGGTQRLLRRIGNARARELIFTGAQLTGEEALRIGLVNRVVPVGELLGEAMKTAQTIAAMAPLAVAAAKRVMLRGEDRPLTEANGDEATAFAHLFSSQDQKDGMAAFLAKQSPTFHGR